MVATGRAFPYHTALCVYQATAARGRIHVPSKLYHECMNVQRRGAGDVSNTSSNECMNDCGAGTGWTSRLRAWRRLDASERVTRAPHGTRTPPGSASRRLPLRSSSVSAVATAQHAQHDLTTAEHTAHRCWAASCIVGSLIIQNTPRKYELFYKVLTSRARPPNTAAHAATGDTL